MFDLSIFYILDLQENICKKVKETYYMLAGEAGQHVVGFGDQLGYVLTFIDII